MPLEDGGRDLAGQVHEPSVQELLAAGQMALLTPLPQKRATENNIEGDFGTFADSKSAPIHRWFQYPAGFSYRAVQYVLAEYGIRPGQMVYDPFVGTGTTLIECKKNNIASHGVEAHPFVHWVAKIKLTWDYEFVALRASIVRLLENLEEANPQPSTLNSQLDAFPALVRKCFSEENLRRLVAIRNAIVHGDSCDSHRDFLLLGLACTLRQASAAATGWPYIAPAKRIEEKPALEAFTRQIWQMYQDVMEAAQLASSAEAVVHLADARNSPLPDEACDLSFTSPPYLNNYDYADRTRLELYFLEMARSWAEISEKIRSRLIISATTQINRRDYDLNAPLSALLEGAAPEVAAKLKEAAARLTEVRLRKGGKKSYDIMVAQYFNDMTLVLQDNFRVLRPGASFVLILGDSAPYGVYVPTHEYLGKIALGLGFKEYQVTPLRRRGSKWPNNSQRHREPLQEVILSIRR